MSLYHIYCSIIVWNSNGDTENCKEILQIADVIQFMLNLTQCFHISATAANKSGFYKVTSHYRVKTEFTMNLMSFSRDSYVAKEKKKKNHSFGIYTAVK